jgi:TldD protein
VNAVMLIILASAPLIETKAVLSPEDDVVFGALKAEVARAMTLSIVEPANNGRNNLQRPYFASGTVDEIESIRLFSQFGALWSRGTGKRFVVTAQVRVGTPTLDNTNYQDFSFDSTRLPAEIDADALRTALWLKFDKSYKSAIEALSRKKAFLETNQMSVALDDFSKAPTVSTLQTRPRLEANLDEWSTVIKKTSAVFLDSPQVLDANVFFEAENVKQWFVSSESAKHRFGDSTVSIVLSAIGQAADGMPISLQKHFTGASLAHLPNEQELVEAAGKLATQISQFVKAPRPQDDYQGPVLFVGEAAPQLFLEILGEPLSNPRAPLGSRIQGRLIERLHKRIAVRTLSARDDASLEYFSVQGKQVPLWGHFSVDDESVIPKPLTLVQNGMLGNYYMSRAPTEKLKGTNGYARGGGAAAGNLFVETSAPESRAALKKKLIELAKDEDLEFGLLVEALSENSAKRDGLSVPAPTQVYRVYADGREEPVRGYAFKPVSQRLMKDIVGMGDEPTVLNTRSNGQTTSVIAPAVLVRLMELNRVESEFAKTPILPRP